MPQASQTLSCPLLKLPPELRLCIYAYTHQFSLNLEVDEEDDREDLSKAWESTHLVKLAATCRLIANETRDYVRSLPSARRTAVMDLSDSRGASNYVTTRMRHLPCPIADLRNVVARYNFKDFQSIIYRSPQAHRRSSVDLAVREKSGYLLDALRGMANATLKKATNLNGFRLQIIGLQPRRDGESYVEAVRRVLHPPKAELASAEYLAQRIFHYGCEDAGMGRDTGTLRLAVLGERPLLLVVPKSTRE